MPIRSFRTPDRAFKDLPGYNFAPHYIEDLAGYEGLRAHYLDEGPKDAEHTFLCLHGQPTWSYLYRKMIPVFAAAGHRVIAPDFLGFGKSDKPTEDSRYTFDFHRNYLIALIERLALHNITLVCQDWGGLLGLTLPVQFPDKFPRMLVMNTCLAVGKLPSKNFADWRAYAAANPDFDIPALLQRGAPHLSGAEAAAYGAPYPNSESRAGARQFPQLVMTEPDMAGADISRQALNFFRNDWKGKCFIACGVADPVLGLPIMSALKADIRGSSELMVIEQGGHFVQEWGTPIAEAALAFFES
jgi:haloalkane dehalogenase